VLPNEPSKQKSSKKEKSDRDSFMVAFGVYGAIGFQLAACIVGGLFAGQWLDRRWGTEPWLTLLGLTFGAVGGFVNFIRILNWKNRQKD
jgi:ATP synthase protein I